MFSSVQTRAQMKSLIEQLRSYSFLHEKENAEHCAVILETILAQHTAYSLLCSGQTQYLEHFASLLIKNTLTEDDIFLLLEDLLIFVREKTLRTGINKANKTEQNALELVFSGTQWQRQDRTLFTDAFFYRTPMQIIQSISSIATEPKSIT